MPPYKADHIDTPKAVGARLRRVRERWGLTQGQLASPNYSAAHISRIESGARTPSLQLLRDLSRRLGVSEEYLATGAQESTAFEDRILEAELAMRLDDIEHAEHRFSELLDIASTSDQKARVLAGLGQIAFRLGHVHLALERLEEAIALFEPEHPPDVVDTLGRSYAITGEMELAIALFRRALDAAREKKDAMATFRFAVLLANALVDTAQFGQAEALLGETLAHTENIHDPLLRARLHWSQSRLHSLQGDAEAAARYARKALELLELREDAYYTARAHQLLAHIELDRGRASEALDLLERGWPLLVRSSSPLDEAVYRLEEARALAKLGRAEEAAALAMEVSGRLAEAPSPVDAGRAYALVAEVFEELGDEGRAVEVLELAAELLKRHPGRFLLEVCSRLADLLKKQGRVEEAFDVLRSAVGSHGLSRTEAKV